MALTDITASAVLKAIEEFEALGQEGFLSRHGYGEARSYNLLHDGRYYPSKAIVGVAHGYAKPDLGPLPSTEFSGGESTVAALLRGLGFEVLHPSAVEEAGGRHGDLIERSSEMMVTAYYLARRGVPIGQDGCRWSQPRIPGSRSRGTGIVAKWLGHSRYGDVEGLRRGARPGAASR